MKQQFIETIKIKNGKALALPYHQARMERTIRRFFPTLASEEINLSSLISPKEEMNLYKARVVYGIQGVKAIEYAPYKMKEIHSLKVVEDNNIDYTYKSTDRSALNALVAQKDDCDEIIIVKNGLIPIPPSPISPFLMATDGSPPSIPCSWEPSVPSSWKPASSRKPTSH